MLLNALSPCILNKLTYSVFALSEIEELKVIGFDWIFCVQYLSSRDFFFIPDLV